MGDKIHKQYVLQFRISNLRFMKSNNSNVATFWGAPAIRVQLICFFTLAAAISWLIWLPLYGPAVGIVGLPVLPYHHILGAFGPLLAAIITTAIYNRHDVPALLDALFNAKRPVLLLLAAFSPFAIGLLAMAADRWLLHTPMPPLSFSILSPDFRMQNIITFTLLNVATFGLGEEAGWRGYALPLLQKRHSALTSSLLLTAFWALWHIPLFLYRPGYVHMEVASIIGWVVSLLTGSVLLTWLFNASKGSILVCAVFHATIDVAFTYPGLQATTISIIGALITVAGLIVAYYMYRQGRLPRLRAFREPYHYLGTNG